MTKRQEMDLWTAFVDGLPPEAGYLRSILGAIKVEVVQAIADDFGFIPWRERVDEQKEHQEEVRKLRESRNELETTVRKLKLQAERLQESIDTLKREARRLGQ